MNMNRPRRKAIPKAVKMDVLRCQMLLCAKCWQPMLADEIEFDHYPALVLRCLNASGTDYEPPQNDPDYIRGLHRACHLQKTTGRAIGAARTVTSKGSDIGLAAKFRRLERPQKRKAKIPSRPFPKKRKFR